MPRCAQTPKAHPGTTPGHRRRRALLAPAAALVAVALLQPFAWSQVARNFPATALRGQITFTEPPEILLNGQATRLSPGSRIRDARNMLVMSGSLTGQKLTVNYTLEPLGQVHDVWILRDEEAARQPWPRTQEQARTWTFDPIGQTWTRP